MKNNEDEIVDYYGTMIVKSEYDFLIELEKELPELVPLNKRIKENDEIHIRFFLNIEDNHIITLYLNNKFHFSIPNNIGNLKRLKILNLNYNLITSLPNSIKNLHSLEKLCIKYNRLSSIPESIGELKSLNFLDLDHNLITSLPESIGDLKSLLFLSLGENEITHLPNSIGNLKSLEGLILYGNKLKSLPDSIENLISLKFLSVINNNLTKLPDIFEKLQSLINLGISYNLLTSIPLSIIGLKTLKIFRVDDKCISSNRLKNWIEDLKKKCNVFVIHPPKEFIRYIFPHCSYCLEHLGDEIISHQSGSFNPICSKCNLDNSNWAKTIIREFPISKKKINNKNEYEEIFEMISIDEKEKIHENILKLLEEKKINPKCAICHSDLCLICRKTHLDCGCFCPNCNQFYHYHCVETYSKGLKNLPINVISCPNCFKYIKLPER